MDPKSPNSAPLRAPGSPPEINLDKKKLIVILAVLGIVLTLLLVFSLRSGSQNTDQGKKQSGNAKEEQTRNPLPSPTEAVVESVYRDEFVEIDYPDDWNYELNLLANDSGKSIFMKPKTLASGNSVPSYIVSYDTDPTTLQDRVKLLESMGLKRSAVSIDNILFIRVSGTSLDRVENDELIEKPMQVSYAFAKINGRTVVIKYLYDGNGVDPQQEKFFKGLIENTHFQRLNQ